MECVLSTLRVGQKNNINIALIIFNTLLCLLPKSRYRHKTLNDKLFLQFKTTKFKFLTENTFIHNKRTKQYKVLLGTTFNIIICLKNA